MAFFHERPHRFHGRLHRLLRRVLPARFRRLRGSDMETAFLTALRKVREDRGWRGVASVWWREALDLIRTGVALRRSRRPSERIAGDGRASILDGLAADARNSVRMLLQTPRSSGLVVLILALGIGLNTAAFSVLETTALRPFHYTDAERIVEVVRGSHQRFSGPFNYRAFEAFRESDEIFQRVAGFRDVGVSMTIGGSSERAAGTEISSGLLDLLGVSPVLGRGFRSDEEGAGRAPVALIAHHLWEEEFGSDPGVLGRTIRVDGVERTVVGVMPAGFTFYQAASVWIPLPVEAVSGDDAYRFSVLGRLREDVTVAGARGAMDALRETIEPLLGEPSSESARLRRTRPLTLRTLSATSMPGGMIFIGGLLQSVTALVLLVVCANIATLLLARGVTRRSEIAVRRALGASRARLVRQLLIEHGILASAGAAAGVLVAHWGHDLLLAMLPSRLLVGIEFVLDGRILAYTGGVAALTVLAAGTLPALELSRLDPGEALRDRMAGAVGSTATRRRRRVAVTQISLSVVLLVGASLTASSMFAFDDVDPGFDARSVFSVLLQSRMTAGDQEPLEGQTRRVIERLEATPGIQSVGWRSVATPDVIGSVRDRMRGSVEIRGGSSSLPADEVGRSYSAGYFRTMGLRLLRGRTFDDTDRPGTSPVAVLSQRAAAILFPGGEAVGREIRVPGATAWLKVVGVVSDVRRISSTGQFGGWAKRAEATADVYLAASQYDAPPNNQFWVRPAVDRATLARRVREVVASVDPGREVTLRTVWEADYEPGQSTYRIVARILIALGAVALALSTLGSYSVVSYSWARRAREVGVRMALGATTRDVFGMVLRDCQSLALVGLLVGTLASLALYRIASGLFFGVSPWDPAVYAGVTVLLLAVAALAGLGPARRATRTDPMETLRRD